jgi:hypothetical protein
VRPGGASAEPIEPAAGTVADQAPPDLFTSCPDDALLTRASFTAYAGQEFLDQVLVVADNGSVDFRFALTSEFPFRPAPDRVVVQVCRAGTDIAFEVCGRPQEYQRPPVV